VVSLVTRRHPKTDEIMAYHHYVSAFHLAEFTPERRREGMLWVFDRERGLRWRSAAGGVGGEQRYNEVQGVPGVSSGEIEAYLSTKYEGPAVSILRSINDTRTVPQGQDLATLLRYIALLSANNPSRRGAMNDAQEQALRFMAGGLFTGTGGFSEIQADLRRAGVPLLGDADVGELMQRVDAGTFSYQMSSTDHVRGLGNLVESLAELLGGRIWSLLIATEEPDFVIGDHPVSLEWQAGQGSEFPPGFGMPNTEVLIPLGRRTALLGLFGGSSRRLVADARVVAEANRRVVLRSRFVYSATPAFMYAAGGDILSSDGLHQSR
jgi:hypothetical protein